MDSLGLQLARRSQNARNCGDLRGGLGDAGPQASSPPCQGTSLGLGNLWLSMNNLRTLRLDLGLVMEKNLSLSRGWDLWRSLDLWRESLCLRNK